MRRTRGRAAARRGLQALDIHAGRVEVADLLRRRALRRRAARPRGLLEQVASWTGPSLHHEVAGNLQLVGGNLCRIEPAAASVAPEVLPRIGRGVHLRRREAEREAEVAGSVGRHRRRSVGRLGRGRASRQQQRRGSPQARRQDQADERGRIIRAFLRMGVVCMAVPAPVDSSRREVACERASRAETRWGVERISTEDSGRSSSPSRPARTDTRRRAAPGRHSGGRPRTAPRSRRRFPRRT